MNPWILSQIWETLCAISVKNQHGRGTFKTLVLDAEIESTWDLSSSAVWNSHAASLIWIYWLPHIASIVSPSVVLCIGCKEKCWCIMRSFGLFSCANKIVPCHSRLTVTFGNCNVIYVQLYLYCKVLILFLLLLLVVANLMFSQTPKSIWIQRKGPMSCKAGPQFLKHCL